MKQRIVKVAKPVMAGCAVLLVLGTCATALVSYRTQRWYADLWSQLGITQQNGNEQIGRSFIHGSLYWYGARNIKKIAAGDRAGVAKELLAYTKKYVQSDAFIKEYKAVRTRSKPVQPEAPKTEAQIRNEQKETVKGTIEKLEKGMAKVQPEYKKMYEENLVAQRQQLKELDDPENKTIKILVRNEQQNHAYRMKEYEANMKAWEENYPENHMLLVKKRLQQVLDIIADVDFNAELTEKNGKKYFVNREYERKSNNWKMAFRAGKEVTETVRAFCEQWIKEIK